MSKTASTWPTTTIKKSSYLRGRIGWQGLRASEFTDNGPFLVTGTDFTDSGRIHWSRCYHVNEARFREGAYIHVRDGDLLITKDGTIGKIAYVRDCPEKVVLNSGVFLLRCSDGSYEHRFLYHLLKSDYFDTFLRVNLTGSTISHLYQYVFERFELPTPNKEIQKKIAEIFSTVDEAIEQTEVLIAKTQQIKAGLMHDLFTRGVTADGQLRPPREEAPQLYKQSHLGWIPREWECEILDNLLAPVACPMRSGPFGSALLKEELVENGIPLLGIDNVFSESFVSKYRRFVTPHKFVELNRYAVLPSDVIITIMGTVGRCCVVPEDIGRALSSKHLWTMTFDRSKILPELVCWQLNYAYWVKEWFARKSQGAVMDAIQSSTLRSLRLTVPSPNEQLMLRDRYFAIQEKLGAESERLRKLREIKQGLMQDLLTGRVPVVVETAPEPAEATANV